MRDLENENFINEKVKNKKWENLKNKRSTRK